MIFAVKAVFMHGPPALVAEFTDPGFEAIEFARLLTRARDVQSVAIELRPDSTLEVLDAEEA